MLLRMTVQRIETRLALQRPVIHKLEARSDGIGEWLVVLAVVEEDGAAPGTVLVKV